MKADKITGFAMAQLPHRKFFDGNLVEMDGNFYALDKSMDLYNLVLDDQLKAALIKALPNNPED